MNDEMKDIRRKIRQAVIKGINEAFNMDDMGNVISVMPSAKQKVAKHSRLYTALLGMKDRFLDMGFELAYVDGGGNEIESADDPEDVQFIRITNDDMKAKGADITINRNCMEIFNSLNRNEDGEYQRWCKWQLDWQKTIGIPCVGGSNIEKDYDGFEHTQILFSEHYSRPEKFLLGDVPSIKSSFDYLPAMAACYNASIELDGGVTAYGYLPSAGQLWVFSIISDIINEVLVMIAAEPIDDNIFFLRLWSSSQYDNITAHILDGLFGKISTIISRVSKDSEYCVFPFFKIKR